MDENNKFEISVGSGKQKDLTHKFSNTIDLDDIEHLDKPAIDLVFVMDTTGSMSNKIEGLLATSERFVEEFAKMNLDHRIAVVAFGDLRIPYDRIERTGFTSDIKVTRKSLRNIPRFSGGGNEGESPLEAIQSAREMSFRSDAVKVLILITDEPAHQDKYTTAEMTSLLMEDEFLVFVVSPSINYYKSLAKKNGGKWYQISASTDFTDLLDMFNDLASKVSDTVSNVYKLSDGNVSKYLQLNSPED